MKTPALCHAHARSQAQRVCKVKEVKTCYLLLLFYCMHVWKIYNLYIGVEVEGKILWIGLEIAMDFLQYGFWVGKENGPLDQEWSRAMMSQKLRCWDFFRSWDV